MKRVPEGAIVGVLLSYMYVIEETWVSGGNHRPWISDQYSATYSFRELNPVSRSERWRFYPCNLSHDMTKTTKWVYAQRRLRSVWASAQSDRSSLCAQSVDKAQAFFMRTAKTDQIGRMPRLIWVFAGHTAILLVLSCCGSFINYHTSLGLYFSQNERRIQQHMFHNHINSPKPCFNI